MLIVRTAFAVLWSLATYFVDKRLTRSMRMSMRIGMCEPWMMVSIFVIMDMELVLAGPYLIAKSSVHIQRLVNNVQDSFLFSRVVQLGNLLGRFSFLVKMCANS